MKPFVCLSVLLFCSYGVTAGAACFSSIESYMAWKYGINYSTDENIVVKPRYYGRLLYHVATDLTSGTNAPMQLLRVKGAQVCEVLVTPPIATIKPIDFDKQGHPISFFAKDQGVTSREIIYVWSKRDFRFNAQSCKEVAWAPEGVSSTAIHCDDVTYK